MIKLKFENEMKTVHSCSIIVKWFFVFSNTKLVFCLFWGKISCLSCFDYILVRVRIKNMKQKTQNRRVSCFDVKYGLMSAIESVQYIRAKRIHLWEWEIHTANGRCICFWCDTRCSRSCCYCRSPLWPSNNIENRKVHTFNNNGYSTAFCNQSITEK